MGFCFSLSFSLFTLLLLVSLLYSIPLTLYVSCPRFCFFFLLCITSIHHAAMKGLKHRLGDNYQGSFPNALFYAYHPIESSDLPPVLDFRRSGLVDLFYS